MHPHFGNVKAIKSPCKVVPQIIQKVWSYLHDWNFLMTSYSQMCESSAACHRDLMKTGLFFFNRVTFSITSTTILSLLWSCRLNLIIWWRLSFKTNVSDTQVTFFIHQPDVITVRHMGLPSTAFMCACLSVQSLNFLFSFDCAMFHMKPVSPSVNSSSAAVMCHKMAYAQFTGC